MRFVLIGLVNGFREIFAHKIRSFLSLTGVVLGVASLITVFAIVKGMQSGWEQWIKQSGGIQRVTVSKQNVTEEFKAVASVSSGVSWEDAKALESCDLIKAISPEISLSGPVVYKGLDLEINVVSCAADYFQIEELALAEGRFICDLDNENTNPVIVLGSLAAETLFGNESPVGKEIFLLDRAFTVVGLMQGKYLGKKSNRWTDIYNKKSYIPLAVAVSYFKGKTSLSSLNVKIVDTHDTAPAVGQIDRVLASTHRGIRDYQFKTKEDQIERFNERAQENMFAGALIGGMSLFIGGIGIMNIMLASISERIREIGIRKAIGATGYDIFVQVLFETVSLSVLGGIFGVLTSFGLVKLLENMMTDPPVMSLAAIVIGFSFSVVSGVLFGLYPAIRASRLNPIEALRAD